MSFDRHGLVQRITTAATHAFKGPEFSTALRASSFGVTTKTVKKTFGDLGKKLQYDVAAAGYPEADEGEWLYDMVWYSVNDGLMLRQIMVLESEFNPGGRGMMAAHVDGDFQKLVQARAEVRVWFVLIPDQEAARLHIANCKSQAQVFTGSLPGDTYVLIVHEWTSSTTEIVCFEMTATGEAQTINSAIV